MKSSSHKQISRLATEYFCSRYSGSELARLFKQQPQLLQALVKGSAAEDYHPVRQRLTNWHFYPANETLKRADARPGRILTMTSLPVLQSWQQQAMSLLKQPPGEDFFSITGRMLHHIQDMSTPAHVVPVYHGLSVHDRYESYLAKHWAQLSSRLAAVEHSSSNQQDDFIALYHQAAQRLLRELAEFRFSFRLNGKMVSADLYDLWQPYDEQRPGNNASVLFSRHRGFGHYGPIARHFGKPSFSNGKDRYDVGQQFYSDVALHFVSHAIGDSLSALQLTDRLLTEAVA